MAPADESHLDVRFTVYVLPPPLSTAAEPWDPNGSEKRPSGTKSLAVPSCRSETINDLWERIEQRFALAYRHQRDLYFSRLQTSDGADLMRFDSVGALYGNLPWSEWKVYMRTLRVAVKDSLPATTALRPEGFVKPELTEEEAERRREQRERYGVEVGEMEVERPVESRERDDGEGRTDQDGFKIPALPKPRSARGRRQRDEVSDSEGEQSRKSKSQTPGRRKRTRSPSADVSGTESGKKKRKRAKAEKEEHEERKKRKKQRRESRSENAGSEASQPDQPLESAGKDEGDIGEAPAIASTRTNQPNNAIRGPNGTQNSEGEGQITPDSGQRLASFEPPESAQRPGKGRTAVSGGLHGEQLHPLSEDVGIQPVDIEDPAVDDDLLLAAEDATQQTNDAAGPNQLPTQTDEALPSSLPLPTAPQAIAETPAARPSAELPSSQTAFDALTSSQARADSELSSTRNWTVREDAILLKSMFLKLKPFQVIARYNLDRSDSGVRGRKRTLLRRFPDASKVDRSTEVGNAAADTGAEAGSSPVKARWSKREAALLRQGVVDGFEDAEIRNMHFGNRSLESVAKQIRRSEKGYWFGEKARKDFPTDDVELKGWKDRHSAFLKRAVREGMHERDAIKKWFYAWEAKLVKRKFQAFREKLEKIGGFRPRTAVDEGKSSQRDGDAEALAEVEGEDDPSIDSSPPWMPDTANRPSFVATPAIPATGNTSSTQAPQPTSTGPTATATPAIAAAGQGTRSSPPHPSPTTTNARPADPPSTGQLRRPTASASRHSRGFLATSGSGNRRRAAAPTSNPAATNTPATITAAANASTVNPAATNAPAVNTPAVRVIQANHARTNSPHVVISNGEQNTARRAAFLAMPEENSQDSQQTTLAFPRDKGKGRADGLPRPDMSSAGGSSQVEGAGSGDRAAGDAAAEGGEQQQECLEIPETVQGDSQQPLTQEHDASADGAVGGQPQQQQQQQQEVIVIDSKGEDDSFATAAETQTPAATATTAQPAQQDTSQQQDGSSPSKAIDVPSGGEESDSEVEEDGDVAMAGAGEATAFEHRDVAPAGVAEQTASAEVQVPDSLAMDVDRVPESFAIPRHQLQELEQAEGRVQEDPTVIFASGKAFHLAPPDVTTNEDGKEAAANAEVAEADDTRSVVEVTRAAHEATTPSSRARRSSNINGPHQFLPTSTSTAVRTPRSRGRARGRHTPTAQPREPEEITDDPVEETSTQQMATAAVTPRTARANRTVPFSTSRRSQRRPSAADGRVDEQITQELEASQDHESAPYINGTVEVRGESDEDRKDETQPAPPPTQGRALRRSSRVMAPAQTEPEVENAPPRRRRQRRSSQAVPDASEDESQAFQTQPTPPTARRRGVRRPSRQARITVPAVHDSRPAGGASGVFEEEGFDAGADEDVVMEDRDGEIGDGDEEDEVMGDDSDDERAMENDADDEDRPMTLEESRARVIADGNAYLLIDPRDESASPPPDMKVTAERANELWNATDEEYMRRARAMGIKEKYVQEKFIRLKAWDMHLRAMATMDWNQRKEFREWERREVLKERAKRGEAVLRLKVERRRGDGDEEADEEMMRDSDIDVGSQCGLTDDEVADDSYMYQGERDRAEYLALGPKKTRRFGGEGWSDVDDDDEEEDDDGEAAPALNDEPRVVEVESEAGEQQPSRLAAIEPTSASLSQQPIATTEENTAEASQRRRRDYLSEAPVTSQSINIYDDSSKVIGERNANATTPPSPTIRINSSAPPPLRDLSPIEGLVGGTQETTATPRSARGWVAYNARADRDPEITDSMLPPWREEVSRQEREQAAQEPAAADDVETALPAATVTKANGDKVSRKLSTENDADLMPPPAVPSSDNFHSDHASSVHSAGSGSGGANRQSRRKRRKSANLRKMSLEQRQQRTSFNAGAVGAGNATGDQEAIKQLRQADAEKRRSSSVFPPSSPPTAAVVEEPVGTSQATTVTASSGFTQSQGTAASGNDTVTANADASPAPRHHPPPSRVQAQTPSRAQARAPSLSQETPLREHFAPFIRNPDPAPPTPRIPEPWVLPSFMRVGSQDSSSSSSSSSD
ncbi:hypothetical protein MBLNU230_g8551t1 [Neophaeotheca triangularis]